MAQIAFKLNNQILKMKNFYLSEILLLPKEVNDLNWADRLEEKVAYIKEIIINYLSSKKDFQNTHHLSFFNSQYANFPIEEVRKMQVEAEYSASLSGQDKRVFVLLNFDTASPAAQNAALKIIEESPKNTLILLAICKKERVLETIISRCLCVPLQSSQSTPQNTNSNANLTNNFNWPQNYSQAIDLAAQNKDRAKAISLLEELLKDKTLQLKTKQNLLRAYQDLSRNQNVQLVLENCFFSLVGLES